MTVPLRLLVAACVLGCGGSSLPEPTILSVQPAQIAADEAPLLVVRADAVAPFQVDYVDRSLTRDPQATLWIGSSEIGALESAPGGLFVAQLPVGLPEGAQDVRLVLADGRSAVSEGALQVLPPRAVVAFALDPIPDQVKDVPFAVTIRAQGPTAGQFAGSVRVFEGKDTPAVPPEAGPFAEGVATLQVTVDHAAPTFVLSVRDGAGRVGFSNPFRVRARD